MLVEVLEALVEVLEALVEVLEVLVELEILVILVGENILEKHISKSIKKRNVNRKC